MRYSSHENHHWRQLACEWWNSNRPFLALGYQPIKYVRVLFSLPSLYCLPNLEIVLQPSGPFPRDRSQINALNMFFNFRQYCLNAAGGPQNKLLASGVYVHRFCCSGFHLTWIYGWSRYSRRFLIRPTILRVSSLTQNHLPSAQVWAHTSSLNARARFAIGGQQHEPGPFIQVSITSDLAAQITTSI
jgi:hypothetical protein